MAYTIDSKSIESNLVRVQVPPPAPEVTCSELRIGSDFGNRNELKSFSDFFKRRRVSFLL